MIAVALLALCVLAVRGAQEADDPDLRAAVERFFATQQSEDVDGYMALWSASAQRPPVEQLKYIFDSGDDTFSEIAILKVTPARDRLRVRVAAIRHRVARPRVDGGPPINIRSRMLVSLTYSREGTEWKLLREGQAADDLAAALTESRSAQEREQLLTDESDLVNELLIVALSRSAGQAAQMRNYTAAQVGFERMLEVSRRVGDRRLEAEALQNLGNTHYFQRNFAEALDAYEQRLAIERERGDDAAVAAALGGIATIRYSFAEYGAALSGYREALAIHERLADEPAIATTLISTGNVLYLQGDFDGAVADYTRSRELYKKGLNTAGEAAAVEGLGRVFMARGDYANALAAFHAVLTEGKARSNPGMQGEASLNIGDVHFRLGNLQTARETFEESRAHFEAAQQMANVGRVWQAIALSDLVVSRFQLAEQEYLKSGAICGVADDRECMAGATAGLAFAQAAQEKFKEAITSYTKAIDAFTKLTKREEAARAEVGLSLALSGSGAYKLAVDAAARARQAAVANENDDVLWRALVAEARALRRLGRAPDRSAALGAARAAVSSVDRLLEASTARPASPVARDSGSAFVMLAVLQAEAGEPAAAFETVERMRTHDMRVTLAASEREIARGMTQAERDEERALAAELVSLHAQLAREKGLPKPDTGRIQQLQRAIGDADARRTVQQRRLFERLPELRLWRGLMNPATRADLTSVLQEPGTVLVQFIVDDEDLLALSVSLDQGGPAFAAYVAPITRRLLAHHVGKLTQPETLGNTVNWRRAASEFAAGIPAPIMTALSTATRSIVVPHEVLWRVPFEALPIESGFVADRTTVVYAGSATALARAPSPARGSPDSASLPHDSHKILAAGAPAVAEAVREQVQQTAPGWMLRAVESTENEMKLLASASELAGRIEIMSGSELTELALRERMSAADAIHIAAPFRINGASVLFSPILLAGQTSREPLDPANDAALELREIMNLDLRARLVVFSDGSAMTMRDAADDAAFVQWGWRASGTPSVVIPRWGADDRACAELMRELHRRVAAGDTPAAALQTARATVRQTDGWAAPLYWAQWMLIDAAAGR